MRFAPEEVVLQVCPECGRATYHRSQAVCNGLGQHPYTEVVDVVYVQGAANPEVLGEGHG